MKTSLCLRLVVASTLCASASLKAQTNYEPYSFSTFAGRALVAGSTDGPRNTALFSSPAGVAVDKNGTVYVADADNHTIRKISSGGVSTLAGLAGVAGSANGTGSAARFSAPTGVAVDSALNVYVADSDNNTIRKITSAGVVTTLAGTPGLTGSANGTGGVARFFGPRGVAVDSALNVYVADTFNHTIRKITPAGVVTTLAGVAGFTGSTNGTGSAARFSGPRGVAVDSSSNVYVADTSNNTIRKITPAAVVSTLAGAAGTIGSSDGPGTSARFFTPIGLTVNVAGTLFVADADNQLIRKVTAGAVVTTLGGLPRTAGSTDGTGSSARFNSPQGAAVDGTGKVYIGDTGNNTIRLGTTLTPPPTPTPTVTPTATPTPTPSPTPATAILANISTRLSVQTGDNVLIGGFIINGSVPKKVLIRGLGPSLTSVPNRMPNPRLELHQGSPTIAENDDWQTPPANCDPAKISCASPGDIPSGFRPSDPRESAIFATLPPGAYTVVMQPSGNTATGVGLVEVYDFDDSSVNAQLKNLSTRGIVQTGDNVMIGGFITSGGNGFTEVVIRAVGPSLLPGIANALANPTLELRNGNGVLMRSNDDWQDDAAQAAAIQAADLAPTNDLESAIFARLPAGGYTAIVAGKNRTTGVALVEVYNLQ